MAKKIMCVDDSTTIRKLVKKAMEPEGYIIIEAENGKDGIAKCAEGEIDLFLGDVNMPEMDGFAFVEHLKKDPAFSKHPIIFLTTESSPQKRKKVKNWALTAGL